MKIHKITLFPRFDPTVLLLLSRRILFFPCPAKTFACDLLPEQKCFFLGCILFDPNGQYIYLVVMCSGTQNSGFLTRIGTKICMVFWSKLGKSYYLRYIHCFIFLRYLLFMLVIFGHISISYKGALINNKIIKTFRLEIFLLPETQNILQYCLNESTNIPNFVSVNLVLK